MVLMSNLFSLLIITGNIYLLHFIALGLLQFHFYDCVDKLFRIDVWSEWFFCGELYNPKEDLAVLGLIWVLNTEIWVLEALLHPAPI